MKGNRLYILVGFLVVLATTLQASTGFYYKRVNFREGMASKVYSIYVDRNDMVWCGTKNGLVRFNDQSLKTYAHDNHKPFSIPFGVVSRVDADSRNRLWVITEQGVALHRSRTDDFVTLFKTKGKPLLAFDLCMVPDGVVFIAADGIYKYNNSSGKLRKVCRPLSPYSPATKLVKYDDNTLFYYGGQKGLVRIDCRTWKTQRMPLLGFKMMECVFVDSKKRIWISPEDIFEGMYCFDKEGRLLHSYPPINSPGGNVVTSVAERYGNIIICTEGNGCYAIDPFTHLVRIYNHVSGDNYYAPPSNSICSIFIDRSGGIWLGTTRQGLLNVRPVSMRTFYEVPFGNEHGLSNGTVLCLFEEAPDRIWVGTDGGGLDLFTPSDNTFKHFPSTFDEKIVSICNLSPGKLLLRAYVKGFYVFDTSTGISTPFVVTNQQSAVAVEKLGQSAELRCLDKENILMLGSTTDGIFNTRTSQIRMIDYKHHDGNVLHYIDNPYNGETFVHDATSIYHLNTLTCNLSLVCRLKGGGVSINTAACGSNGNFCIGTNRGLFIYYAKKGILIPKRTKLFNSVNVILIDMKDKMWVATTNRVFDWVRSKQRFMVFGETDGVLSNEYMPRVGLRASNGCFYFGCTNGLLAIDKSFQVKRINRGRLVLADLTVNGKATPEPLTQSIPQLEVKSNSNISLRVMNVEHDLFRQKVYRFYIKGFSGNYFESFSPTFELRGLPTGHYRILVSVMLGDGSWTPYQQVLDLSMVPPWYLDSWFVSVSISLLLIVLYIVSRRIMYNRSSRMKWEIDARERQVNNDKMNFLIDITHELRTPLTLIHAPLDRMLKTMPATNPLYDRLKAVLRQTTRMKHLINMVLDVHKMETSETRLRIQPNNLNSWLRQVTEDFANEGNAQGIALVYDFDEQVDIVSFDKDKCDMVIYNLLGNAMKHSSAGGHIYVCTRLTTDANHVRITISDEGPGLKGVDPAKLFQRFYQGGNETVGSGIGLSYSKILVEQHGGTIGAYNNKTAGASFYFELPLGQASEVIVNQPYPYLSEMVANESESADEGLVKIYDMSRYKILVVDDNVGLARFLAEALSSYFKEVYTASDGVEALTSIRNNMPDVVVSDVMMPRKDGFELCKEIKQTLAISHILVILLTARDDTRSQTLGYKNGADGYLTKPFEVDILVELLSNRLLSREQARNRYMSAGLLPVIQETTFSSADESFMAQLDKVISDNIQRADIDIPLLCKEMAMSRSAIYKKLKAITNMGSSEYINKFRMETAVNLIKTTDMSFTQIAEKVGISSSRYFSTLFKHYIGDTPSEYRKRYHDSVSNMTRAVPDESGGTPTP